MRGVFFLLGASLALAGCNRLTEQSGNCQMANGEVTWPATATVWDDGSIYNWKFKDRNGFEVTVYRDTSHLYSCSLSRTENDLQEAQNRVSNLENQIRAMEAESAPQPAVQANEGAEETTNEQEANSVNSSVPAD